jgi:histidyl-tRNA synthetase
VSAERQRAPRGTHDTLPEESSLIDGIVDVAREVFEGHGYGHIVTPTFEHTEIFERGVGGSTDIVRKEMYTFDDRSGRSITLRPEGTAPVARAFVEHGMHKRQLPVKLWYAAPMFRYEAPQAGRLREHRQIGVEALGSDDPLLDVEVIALLDELYRRLRLPGLRLHISSMGDAESRAAHRELLFPYLEAHREAFGAEARARVEENPLRLFDSKDPAVQEVMAGAPRLMDSLSEAAREHHRRVLEGLDALDIAHESDPGLVRGMDYYTRTVFEFTSDLLGAQSGVGGGGRYDGLVEQLGGPPTPGIGFGSGLERIAEVMRQAGVAGEAPGVDVYVAILDDELRTTLLPLVRDLRRAGRSVETDLRGRGLKAILRHAAAVGAGQAVIIGRRDYDQGVATVRDMASGEQREVALDALAESLA